MNGRGYSRKCERIEHDLLVGYLAGTVPLPIFDLKMLELERIAARRGLWGIALAVLLVITAIVLGELHVRKDVVGDDDGQSNEYIATDIYIGDAGW